jgi:glycyl-tRNA synthetase beta chain
VPQECLILTMQQNQKYFALADAEGRLVNRFLLVSNIATENPARSSAATSGCCAPAGRRTILLRPGPQDSSRRACRSSRASVYHNKLGSQLQRVHAFGHRRRIAD